MEAICAPWASLAALGPSVNPNPPYACPKVVPNLEVELPSTEDNRSLEVLTASSPPPNISSPRVRLMAKIGDTGELSPIGGRLIQGPRRP